MKALQYRLEVLLVRMMLFLLRRLGAEASSNLGGFLARSIGPLLPVTRIGDANLRLVLPELDGPARRRILRDVWDNLGRTAAELPHIAQLERNASGPGWEIEGAEIVERLALEGGPSILFSGHIGNWELLPKAAGHFGIRMSSFYRAASNPEVDAMIMQLRNAAVGEGVPNFAKGSQGARAALAYLGHGGHLGMLIDQKMNDGIAVPFFGRPAMTAPAAAAFALRYRCKVIPAHVERIGPARLRLVVE